MTPEQVAMVQTSFVRLVPRGDEVAGRFYERLFELAPDARALFSTDPAVQRAKFMAELGEIVQSISHFDEFVARTRDLGARHLAHGATHEHYQVMGVALLETFADALGPAFTPELRDAWRLAYDMVAEVMMQGAAEATPRK